MDIKNILEKREISASVPCRIDLGGTLDISTFFLPMNHLSPSTFNIALDIRTFVKLSPWTSGKVKISSRGFESAEFDAQNMPFTHPMGLMFAVASYFNVHGVHIEINSTSPPRSALGGSSAAAVAMIAAFRNALTGETDPARAHCALAAHYIEASVAGVPCGLQDQLAAAFGGVNRWHWRLGSSGISFEREDMTKTETNTKNDQYISGHESNPSPATESSDKSIDTGMAIRDSDREKNCSGSGMEELNRNILVAYCGIPHVSKDINGRWVREFLSGKNRERWAEIIDITSKFSDAFKKRDFNLAAYLMNRETAIRVEMTPDVLDRTGKLLFECAADVNCGARFTGAGGGGCLWAVGEKENIDKLRSKWQSVVDSEDEAGLLESKIDFRGIVLGC